MYNLHIPGAKQKKRRTPTHEKEENRSSFAGGSPGSDHAGRLRWRRRCRGRHRRDRGRRQRGGGRQRRDQGIDAFFAVPGSEIIDDNEIQQLIAEKTGAKVKETWLTGQTAAEAVGTMIAGGEYPDFIDGVRRYHAVVTKPARLIPIDEYFDDYPNIKNYLTETQWGKTASG